jgi:hypothetical protein
VKVAVEPLPVTDIPHAVGEPGEQRRQALALESALDPRQAARERVPTLGQAAIDLSSTTK